MTYDTQKPQIGGVKEKGDKGASYSTDNIIPPLPSLMQVEPEKPTKRKAGSAGLDEGGEGVHGLKKARRIGQCAAPGPRV